MTSPSNISSTDTSNGAAADPFSSHRDPLNNPFTEANTEKARSFSAGDHPGMTQIPLTKRDRRLSKEWDAAQTPPSKFQRPPHSIFATPASRDGHIARNKIHGFKEKVKELTGKKS